MAGKILCPQCGHLAAKTDIRCPRCNKLLLTSCSGNCSSCGKNRKCKD